MSLVAWEDAGIIDRELKLYKELSRAYGHEFTFITFGDSNDLKYEDMVPNSRIIPVYEISKYRKSKTLRFLNSLLVSRKINKTLNNPDLIKTNQLMGFWVGLGIKYKYRCPLIVRTGYDAYGFAIKNKSFLIKSMYYIFTQISILVSDIYLVTTRKDKLFLKKTFIQPKNKIKVMPNWVEADVPYKELKKRKNEIISVGRLETQKNFTYLISEFSNTNFALNIIGDGTLKKHLHNLSKSVNSNVKFLRRMPNSELIDFLTNFKYFVLSSHYEGNPKVVLEAMAAGCIVLVNNFPGIEEIITNEVDGVIIGNKKGELIKMINFLEEDNECSVKLSKNAVITVEENFSLKAHIEKENFLYKSLTGN